MCCVLIALDSDGEATSGVPTPLLRRAILLLDYAIESRRFEGEKTSITRTGDSDSTLETHVVLNTDVCVCCLSFEVSSEDKWFCTGCRKRWGCAYTLMLCLFNDTAAPCLSASAASVLLLAHLFRYAIWVIAECLAYLASREPAADTVDSDFESLKGQRCGSFGVSHQRLMQIVIQSLVVAYSDSVLSALLCNTTANAVASALEREARATAIDAKKETAELRQTSQVFDSQWAALCQARQQDPAAPGYRCGDVGRLRHRGIRPRLSAPLAKKQRLHFFTHEDASLGAREASTAEEHSIPLTPMASSDATRSVFALLRQLAAVTERDTSFSFAPLTSAPEYMALHTSLVASHILALLYMAPGDDVRCALLFRTIQSVLSVIILHVTHWVNWKHHGNVQHKVEDGSNNNHAFCQKSIFETCRDTILSRPDIKEHIALVLPIIKADIDRNCDLDGSKAPNFTSLNTKTPANFLLDVSFKPTALHQDGPCAVIPPRPKDSNCSKFESEIATQKTKALSKSVSDQLSEHLQNPELCTLCGSPSCHCAVHNNDDLRLLRALWVPPSLSITDGIMFENRHTLLRTWGAHVNGLLSSAQLARVRLVQPEDNCLGFDARLISDNIWARRSVSGVPMPALRWISNSPGYLLYRHESYSTCCFARTSTPAGSSTTELETPVSKTHHQSVTWLTLLSDRLVITLDCSLASAELLSALKNSSVSSEVFCVITTNTSQSCNAVAPVLHLNRTGDGTPKKNISICADMESQRGNHRSNSELINSNLGTMAVSHFLKLRRRSGKRRTAGNDRRKAYDGFFDAFSGAANDSNLEDASPALPLEEIWEPLLSPAATLELLTKHLPRVELNLQDPSMRSRVALQENTGAYLECTVYTPSQQLLDAWAVSAATVTRELASADIARAFTKHLMLTPLTLESALEDAFLAGHISSSESCVSSTLLTPPIESARKQNSVDSKIGTRYDSATRQLTETTRGTFKTTETSRHGTLLVPTDPELQHSVSASEDASFLDMLNARTPAPRRRQHVKHTKSDKAALGRPVESLRRLSPNDDHPPLLNPSELSTASIRDADASSSTTHNVSINKQPGFFASPRSRSRFSPTGDSTSDNDGAESSESVLSDVTATSQASSAPETTPVRRLSHCWVWDVDASTSSAVARRRSSPKHGMATRDPAVTFSSVVRYYGRKPAGDGCRRVSAWRRKLCRHKLKLFVNVVRSGGALYKRWIRYVIER